MNDEQMQPLLEGWFKDRELSPADVPHSASQVMARLPEVRQRGRGWPLPVFDRPVSTFPGRELTPAPIPATNGRQPVRGFTMFSALKFVVASVIVALFGGFLLMGILGTPQGDEMAPAAVTESPSPMTTEEVLSGMVAEEVEPGIFRVINDGVEDLAYQVERGHAPDVVAGGDGGIWVLQWDGYHRLGEGLAQIDRTEGEVDFVTRYEREWPLERDEASLSDFEVATDGTVLAVFTEWDEDDEEVRYVYSVAKGSDDWTRTTGRANIEVSSEGTVWAVWPDDPGDPDSLVLGYLGAAGWQPLGEWPYGGGHSAMYVSDQGDVWAVGVDTRAHHFVDGAWRSDDVGKLYRRGRLDKDGIADVGVDGTLWGIMRDDFVRFDGTEWTTFRPFDASSGSEPHVAPDGSLWVLARLGGPNRPVCDHGIDGVVRFDGEEWTRPLQGYCVESMDIAADGSVWLLATESDARFPFMQPYVITPEAVTATE